MRCRLVRLLTGDRGKRARTWRAREGCGCDCRVSGVRDHRNRTRAVVAHKDLVLMRIKRSRDRAAADGYGMCLGEG